MNEGASLFDAAQRFVQGVARLEWVRITSLTRSYSASIRAYSSLMDGTPDVDDRLSDADAGIDQLDRDNGFGTGHFGASVRTGAGCVEQV